MPSKRATVDYRSSKVSRWIVRGGLLPLAILVGATAVTYAYDTAWIASGQPVSAAKLKADLDEAQMRIGALEGEGVPSGAVLAFNMMSCPTGWSVFEPAGGRTVIGVNPVGGNGLSQRNLRDVTGEETHSMSVEEMPAHSHTYEVFGGVGSFSNNSTGLWTSGGSAVQATYGKAQPSDATGSGTAFNQMQPSVALLYCVKN
jgi:hypothetical protein